MARRTAYTVAVALTLLLAASCSVPPERSAYESMPPRGWDYTDTVALAPDTAASASATGRVAVAVRHRADLEWANVWVELTYTAADTARRDTVSLRLADDRGRWLGSGVGVAFQRVDTIAGVRARADRPIYVRHVMRPDQVEGIEQVGVIFVPD